MCKLCAIAVGGALPMATRYSRFRQNSLTFDLSQSPIIEKSLSSIIEADLEDIDQEGIEAKSVQAR